MTPSSEYRPAEPRPTGTSGTRGRLVIFSDDWGRHASSAQFLTEQWLGRYDVEWIETIGTRSPSVSAADAGRAAQKLVQWIQPPRARARRRARAHPGLRIHAPLMWPSFSSPRGRRTNSAILRRTLRAILAGGPKPAAVISTVPLVADVAVMFPAEHWVYYCVDALQDWDALDGEALGTMEREWVPRCDAIVAASEGLAARLRSLSPKAQVQVVTHGVDFDRWRGAEPGTEPQGVRQRALFVGAVDERMDSGLCARIAASVGLVAVGPSARAPRALRQAPGLELWGPRPHGELPALASGAGVLVLPYRTDTTTQSLAPLKLKEYLATDRPVVVSNLAGVAGWAGALDVATDGAHFADLVARRVRDGADPEQLRAREALRRETWAQKASLMEASFQDQAPERAATVLHVRSCGGPGSGPEKTLLRSHLYGDPARYRVVVAILADPGDREIDGVFREAQELGASFRRVDDGGPLDRRVLPALVEIARSEGASLWHGHDAKSNLLGLRARRQLGLKLVGTAHGWVHRTARTPLYDALDRWTLRRFEGVIAVSTETLKALGQSRSREAVTTVIENGVELPEPEACWTGPSSGPLVIGAVGRLEPEKGLEHLLRAASILSEQGVEVRLRVFGVGSEGDPLRRLADTLGLGPKVEFCGFEADRHRIFSALDLFVLPSLREGTPNSLLEAMAFGRPIVATRVGGVEELVRHGDEALVVAPGDHGALADAIATLARDPALAARLAQGALTAAKERHTFKGRMGRVFAVYDQVLAASPR